MKFWKFLLNKFVHTYTVQPKTKDELIKIINDTIKEKGVKADLNFIDTSKITDMTKIFHYSEFNGDISKWDVSNVKTKGNMFKDSPLEGKEPNWYKDWYKECEI